MAFSNFGEKFTKDSGITLLMDDLNDGLQNPDAIMLGGGNPASIPEVLEEINNVLKEQLNDGSLLSTVANYDGPQGKDRFINQLVELFRNHLGWDVTKENITLTSGSQSAFFYLFNLYSGEFPDGTKKRVVFPISPEYIGYSDSGLDTDIFSATQPQIKELDNRMFKYYVDFDNLNIDDSVGAFCVSRPTNPTGNVITDAEVEKLAQIADENNIPLIVDNAYGLPFPDIMYADVQCNWDERMIMCMSLSKLGLPGTRCGIVIAKPEISRTISNLNGIFSLSPGGIGPNIASSLFEKNKVLSLSQNVIKPYYFSRAKFTLELINKYIKTDKLRIHKPEGAFFLWLWFKDLPIDSKELYERLKKRGVLIIPGNDFFIGLKDTNWKHSKECIRLSYIASDEDLEKGIKIIAEEIDKAYL